MCILGLIPDKISLFHRPTAPESNVIGRKNYHDYTFFAAFKHHGIDSEVWRPDVLNRIQDYKASRLYELIPKNWETAPI